MRIVVDAMGTDRHPTSDIAGAVLAAQETRDTMILVGNSSMISAELIKYPLANLKIEVVDAQQAISMTDKPSQAIKEKTESSIHVGLRLVQDGAAEAFVSAGNTGAIFAVSMLSTIKRIPGIKRPALSAIFPINGKPMIFIDVGANSECKAEWLSQFAVMGNIYAEKVLHMINPRIGLLSNGEEEGKGTQLTQEANALMHQLSLNYIGNVEPTDVMNNNVDIVVSDGFTGNILIKTFESSTRYLGNIIRQEINASPISMLGGLLARSAFLRARNKIDAEIGGAPLLGVNGVVIVAHGRSNDIAIKNAIIQARNAVESNVVGAIHSSINPSIES